VTANLRSGITSRSVWIRRQLVAKRSRTSRRAFDVAKSTNEFHSVNASDNWVFGGTKLNEFVFQVSTFDNVIPAASPSRR
jgi:hypothetical protein